mmetsp:Transcript_48799/g.76171  ORF Transcript_48799/g.76171 Transcript_48799/m.76171 type:complete len:312 (-) Transcript_48799:31-966(-)
MTLRPSAPKALSLSAPKAVRTGSATSLKMGLFDAIKNLAMPTEVAGLATDAPEVPEGVGASTWAVGVYEVPDPRHKMEDAWFADEYDYGIFDGVTGAKKAETGDIYSFQLAGNTYANMQKQRKNGIDVDPRNALDAADVTLNDVNTVGASTAIVVTVDQTSEPGFTILKGANIGDSGISVFRRSPEGALECVYKTIPQMHYFNCPFQLGGASPDSADQATRIRCPLLPGDVAMIASDGVYDNVFESQIIDLLEQTWGQDPNYQAQAIVAYARQQQEDPNAVIPYGIEAQENGESWTGGKLDDTVALILQFN